MTLTIQPASSDDVYIIISLQSRIWQTACETYLSSEQMDYMFEKIYSPISLKQEIQSGQNYFILNENNIPQGFVSYSLSTSDVDTYRLNKVFILPESQGKGFGKKLIDHVEIIARNNNAKFLDLYVNRKNSASNLYQKIDFEITEEIDIPIGPYVLNDYKMRKTL